MVADTDTPSITPTSSATPTPTPSPSLSVSPTPSPSTSPSAFQENLSVSFVFDPTKSFYHTADYGIYTGYNDDQIYTGGVKSSIPSFRNATQLLANGLITQSTANSLANGLIGDFGGLITLTNHSSSIVIVTELDFFKKEYTWGTPEETSEGQAIIAKYGDQIVVDNDTKLIVSKSNKENTETPLTQITSIPISLTLQPGEQTVLDLFIKGIKLPSPSPALSKSIGGSLSTGTGIAISISDIKMNPSVSMFYETNPSPDILPKYRYLYPLNSISWGR